MRFKEFMNSVLLSTLLNVMIFNFVLNTQKAFSDETSFQTVEQPMKTSIKNNGRFMNHQPVTSPSFGQGLKIFWQFLFNRYQRSPEEPPPVQKVDLTHFLSSAKNHLSSTWLGHSSLLINLDGYRITTDPVFQKRVSFFGPTRYNGDVPLAIEDLPEIDLLLISHNHYDHLNRFSIEKLHNKTKKVLVPLGVKALLVEWGVPAQKIREMDWWDEWALDDQLSVVFTPTQHFSGRGLFDRNKTLWGSFVVVGPTHKIFYGGDSGYFEGFKLIGRQYGPFDLTFLECGAYNARYWPDIHMLPEQTVQAHLDLRGKILQPIHWGTFNLALHPWDEPMLKIVIAAQKNGVKLATPRVGQDVVLPDQIPQEAWWEFSRQKKTNSALTY